MSRQYFTGGLADGLITPLGAVSPATTKTSIFGFSTQALKYMPLPFGANAPSPGQMFRVMAGGLFTSVAGTFIISPYHGPGSSATAFGTALGDSQTLTLTAWTAGYFYIDGVLTYRTISEVATSSTCWFAGRMMVGGPPANAVAPVTFVMGSAAAITVDTTGAANTSGCLNFAVTPGTTGSTWTPEWAFMEAIN